MTNMMMVTEKSKGFTRVVYLREILILGGNKLRIAMTEKNTVL